jgi:hypothetical protein
LDNGESGGGASTFGGFDRGAGFDTSGLFGNQLNGRADRGLSDFDRTHRFAVSFLWDLPKPAPSHTSRVGRLLFSDWQMSGIVTVMSGVPVNIFDEAGGSLYGFFGDRPDWAPGANRSTAMSNIPEGYHFNPFAFVRAVVQAGQPIPSANEPTAIAGDQGTDFGNVRRNVLRGPGQSNLDLSIAKRFAVSEAKSAEFRLDLFNAFNHPNLNNPISDIGSAQDIDPNTGRVLSPGDFGRIVGHSSSPRIMQVALKFSF